MSFKYRWRPNATQKREYRERMVAIESEGSELPSDEYSINCTGDCCLNDEVAFFNPAKSSERFYGKIVHESYGAEKQQHTFTIELQDGEKVMIKGRNLYKNGCHRKAWSDETERQKVLDEKHERGNVARVASAKRKNARENNYLKAME